METRKVKVIKIGIIVFLFLLLDPTFVRAKRMTKQEIRSAVTTWVRLVTADAQPDAVIEKMEAYMEEDETVAYIAHLEDGGYCLCSVDDRLWPAYIYSPEGTYDPDDPGDQYFLGMISDILDYAREYENNGQLKSTTLHQDEMDFRHRYWDDLINGRIPEQKPPDETKGFIPGKVPDNLVLNMTSEWGQDRPYSDQCPPKIPQNILDNYNQQNAAVGCGPNAAAAIMRYWKWPLRGEGHGDVEYKYRYRPFGDPAQYPFEPPGWVPIPHEWRDYLDTGIGYLLSMAGYWDNELYEEAKKLFIGEDYYQDYLEALSECWDQMEKKSINYSANFSKSINWSLIKNEHWINDPVSDDEITDFLFRVGVAMKADYGMMGTGTDEYDAENALEDHFYYDRDAQVRDSGIWDKLIDEIRWLRPVYMSGWQEANKSNPYYGKDGHSWVVFGFNRRNGQTYINTGNYAIELYTLDEYFPLNQTILRRIAPERVVKFIGDTNSGSGRPGDPYEDIEEALNEIPSRTKTLIFKAGSINTVRDGFTMYSPHGHALSIKTDIHPGKNSGIYKIVIKPE